MSAITSPSASRGETSDATRPLKVLHLVAPAPFGGLEQVVYSLSVGQKQKGYEVYLVALLESGAPDPSVISKLRGAGIPVISVIEKARAFRAQRRSLLQICESIGPDVVHSHGYLPDVLSASLGSRFRAARVSTVHGFTGGRWRNRLYEWMQRRSYGRLDAIVAVSQLLAGELRSARSRRRKVHALPNAWIAGESPLSRESARIALKVSSDSFNIGWIGRISREKGLDILIEALPALNDLPVHITVIGEGPERATLQARARELRVDDRISWQGQLSEASRLMPGLDLLVISSRTEGTPITLFEAIDAGVPIVATSVGGIPEVLSADDAMLVPTENPTALAAAIRAAYEAPGDARERAAHARLSVRTRHDPAVWIGSYDKIYHDALSRRAVR